MKNPIRMMDDLIYQMREPSKKMNRRLPMVKRSGRTIGLFSLTALRANYNAKPQ
ncbi:hypothetical protein [Lactovum miscens]|uniref:Uncharacterized protein n=1 Tax=Lactovum miscens TaxID=190387 RepID=A0A841C372_9LACT|nr:hypothetical protein [Lactovum miscens]MBB5888406.1 hypothetical protein [Lactovum miscens]